MNLKTGQKQAPKIPRLLRANERTAGKTLPLTAGAAGYERLLSEDEVIAILCLSDRPNPSGSLRWLIRTKRLPCIRIGRGIIRFRPQDLQVFIENCRRD